MSTAIIHVEGREILDSRGNPTVEATVVLEMDLYDDGEVDFSERLPTASWENLTGTRPTWVPEKKVNLLVQFTMERKPYVKDVPTLIELSSPEKRDVAELVISGTPVSRAIALGPGVPADRVAALRTAFEATMKDPEFLADCEKRKLGIDPISHQQLHAMITKIVTASPELVARVKKAIGQVE